MDQILMHYEDQRQKSDINKIPSDPIPTGQLFDKYSTDGII